MKKYKGYKIYTIPNDVMKELNKDKDFVKKQNKTRKELNIRLI